MARACPLRAQGDVKPQGAFVTQPFQKDGRAAPGCYRCGICFDKEASQSDEQKVSRLRAERDQLQRDNEVLTQERASAIAQAEAAQRRSSRAAPEERKSALGSCLNEALETAVAQRDEAIAAMAASAVRAKGRATKRPDAALSREALAAEAACKAQQQRDEALLEKACVNIWSGNLDFGGLDVARGVGFRNRVWCFE